MPNYKCVRDYLWLTKKPFLTFFLNESGLILFGASMCPVEEEAVDWLFKCWQCYLFLLDTSLPIFCTDKWPFDSLLAHEK